MTGSQPWTVAGYEAVELLGQGGTGEVWRARVVREQESDPTPGPGPYGVSTDTAEGATWTPAPDLAAGPEVALKRLRTAPGRSGGRSPVDRVTLRREAAALVRVAHPHVLRVREVLASGDDVVLVLELAQGGDLASLLARRGRMGAAEVVAVLEPVARGLAAVHRSGMVHGDVSAANVLFRADGTPVLGDLGSARLIGRGLDRALLTCAYADPHVAAGNDPDQPGDVFGLAAVGWHMVAGRPLWDAQHPAQVVAQAQAWNVAEAVPGAPDGSVPVALIDLLRDALAPYRGVRCSASEFAERVAVVCAAEPVRLEGSDPIRTGPPEPAVTVEVAVPLASSGVPASSVAGRRDHSRSARKRPGRRESFRTWHRVVAAVCATALVAAGLGLAAHSVVVKEVADSADAPEAGSLPGTPVPAPPTPDTADRGAGSPTVSPDSPRGPGGGADGGTGGHGADAPADAGRSGAAPDAPQTWAVLVRRLVAARSAAYAALDPDLLAEVYAPDAPGLAKEVDRLAGYVRRGTPAIVSHRVVEVDSDAYPRGPEDVPAESSRVTLLVAETAPVVSASGPEGAAPGPTPERGAGSVEVRQVRMVLARVGQRWLVYQVTAV